MDFLRVHNGKIVDGRRRSVRLRGVNLGNWLMLEGYMLAGPNEPERRIRRHLARGWGLAAMKDFFRRYQKIWVSEKDILRIKSWGFNFLRVPFNHRLFTKSPQGKYYDQTGFERLDWLVSQCRRRGMYCLFDLHAAPGCQNHDWHSDSAGESKLWSSPRFQNQMVELWGKIASRYKNEPAVAGYDIVNEPITKKTGVLRRLYKRCLAGIRATGDNHIVFLEGTLYATEFESLRGLEDENLAVSLHFYEPHPFTFNWAMDQKYPGKINGRLWNKNTLRKSLSFAAEWSRKNKVPVLAGEFGVNTRCPHCRSESKWVSDMVDIFNENGFHWTYWPYKAISTYVSPSGLLRFPQDPAWLRREGVTTGWENFTKLHAARRGEILTALSSDNFTVDQPILDVLRRSL